MTPQEAIKYLSDGSVCRHLPEEYDWAVNEGIEALEKQIPKKAKDVSDDGIERYVCECGNLMHDKQKYCERCGQALNWR